jgi:hypothetical protein
LKKAIDDDALSKTGGQIDRWLPSRPHDDGHAARLQCRSHHDGFVPNTRRQVIERDRAWDVHASSVGRAHNGRTDTCPGQSASDFHDERRLARPTQRGAPDSDHDRSLRHDQRAYRPRRPLPSLARHS